HPGGGPGRPRRRLAGRDRRPLPRPRAPPRPSQPARLRRRHRRRGGPPPPDRCRRRRPAVERQRPALVRTAGSTGTRPPREWSRQVVSGTATPRRPRAPLDLTKPATVRAVARRSGLTLKRRLSQNLLV